MPDEQRDVFYEAPVRKEVEEADVVYEFCDHSDPPLNGLLAQDIRDRFGVGVEILDVLMVRAHPYDPWKKVCPVRAYGDEERLLAFAAFIGLLPGEKD